MSQLIHPFDNVYKTFVEFAWKNNILASTAGFTIGLATKDFIEKVMKHLGFGNGIQRFQLLVETWLRSLSIQSQWLSTLLFIVGDFLVWIAAIVFTFVIATYIMAYFLPQIDVQKRDEKIAAS